MHPEFFEMLQIAKDAGCIVGTTTNGTLVGREFIEKMVRQGLDVIGFSLAGVDEKNDKIREGTRINKFRNCETPSFCQNCLKRTIDNLE